jgi:CubicO group peptidase (beta-lactamase class C family)
MNRREFGRTLSAMAACGWSLPAQAQAPANLWQIGWAVPSRDEIRRLLAERIDIQRQDLGLVVGAISPSGRTIVSHGSSGAADGRPLDGDSVFQIGSVSKPFVTLLLSEMVLAGEAGLDDPAQDYLPRNVRMPRLGRPITLRDLATHMSGLPSLPTNFDLKAAPNPVEAYTIGQWYEFLSSYQLPREPGTKLEYSNQGVALLGHLLSLRAGKPYEQLVKTRVVEPLALASTAITPGPEMMRRLAPGHDMYRQPVESWEMRSLQASGSMRSTANDLLTLLAAYLGLAETPLKPAMAFQTAQSRPEHSSTDQSLGLVILPSANGPVFFHDGGKEGYRALIAFSPALKSGIVVLANTRSQANINALGLHLLSGRAMPPPQPAPPPPIRPGTVLLPRRTLDSYEGRYRLEPDQAIKIACIGDRLLLDLLGDGVSEFFASAEKEYFSRTSDATISFLADGQGHATGLTLQQGGKRQTWLRA